MTHFVCSSQCFVWPELENPGVECYCTSAKGKVEASQLRVCLLLRLERLYEANRAVALMHC